MENVRQLLSQAFESQDIDARRWRRLMKESRYVSGIALEDEPYEYRDQLPYGTVFLGRSDSFSGVGEPFLIFRDPIDIDLMSEKVNNIFGKNIEVVYDLDDKSFNVRSMDPNHVSRRANFIFAYGQSPFQRFHGFGMVEYYTESDDKHKLIEAIARYLECKYPLEASTSQKDQPE